MGMGRWVAWRDGWGGMGEWGGWVVGGSGCGVCDVES